jgi:hypothetical protein
MDKLLETANSLRIDQPLEESMDAIVYGIQESTPFSVVLVSTYDPASENLVRITGAGLPIDTINALRARTHPWNAIKPLLKPAYRISHSYLIPADKKPFAPAEIHTGKTVPLPGGSVKEKSLIWQSEDLLLVPLLMDDDEPLGMISVDAPRNGLRPDRPTIEALEIFASRLSYHQLIKTRIKRQSGRCMETACLQLPKPHRNIFPPFCIRMWSRRSPYSTSASERGACAPGWILPRL